MNTTQRIEDVRIAAPCPMSWNDMEGDDHVRVCRQCDKKVYDFTTLSPAEVLDLLDVHEGNLCAHMYGRPDGTMIVDNCPVGLAAVRRRARRLMGGLAAVVVLLITSVAALGLRRASRLERAQPFRAIIEKFDPPRLRLAGSICIPSTKTASPRTPAPPGTVIPLTINGESR